MKKNSTKAKSIPEVALCESHHSNGRKQSYTAEALSESEINAVIQLIQLSSADSCSDHTDHHQEDYDNSSNNKFSFFSFSSKVDSDESVDPASSSSYSSSSLPPPGAAVLLMEAEKGELAEEEDNDGDDFDRSNFSERRNKRYRSIVELYRVTDETVLTSVVESNKRKKMKKEM